MAAAFVSCSFGFVDSSNLGFEGHILSKVFQRPCSHPEAGISTLSADKARPDLHAQNVLETPREENLSTLRWMSKYYLLSNICPWKREQDEYC